MQHYETLNDLLIEQIQDLYDAEYQIAEAMPRMARAAKSTDLNEALADHHRRIAEHLARLREVFGKLGVKVERKPCGAMVGLIAEANEILQATGDRDVIDAALIAVVQRIEHYEIAAYGCVIAFASEAGQKDIVNILEDTIKEAGASNRLLSKIAEGGFFGKSVNKDASGV